MGFYVFRIFIKKLYFLRFLRNFFFGRFGGFFGDVKGFLFFEIFCDSFILFFFLVCGLLKFLL